MKLHFGYKNVQAHVNGIDLRHSATVKERETDWDYPYNKYLCGWLESDVQTARGCSGILSQIAELERHERDSICGSGNAWFVTIYREYVEFELQTADDDPEWPIWKCSLDEVKIALTGWQKFLEMPESLESQVEIDLPTA